MDMNCPDGMPLVWLGKMKGNSVSRVCGPEFMPAFCAASASKGYRHFFYGGREGVAEKVAAQLKKESPDLQIAGTFCPPFRELSAEEDLAIVRRINESGADIVWVCLGCPKQEYWISDHQSRLKAGLLLSVGMAFDTISKERQRAHPILRAIGLEWLYRVISEPRRMVGRYYRSNSLFLRLLVREFILGKRHN
jgi:N-acetylglucosaminyldiphosphoundecaprenol N-acetyl-beta-D-mannosaminyltransferase